MCALSSEALKRNIRVATEPADAVEGDEVRGGGGGNAEEEGCSSCEAIFARNACAADGIDVNGGGACCGPPGASNGGGGGTGSSLEVTMRSAVCAKKTMGGR